MLNALYAITRLSITLVYQSKTVEARIISPHGSPHRSSFSGVSFMQKF